MLVDPRALVPQVVGADDRRVAPGIAKPNRAFFEDRDIADAVLSGEVIGGGKTMPAAADDHHLIARPRRRLAPRRLPEAVPGQRVPREGEDRISLHRRRLVPIAARAKRGPGPAVR